MTHAGWDVDIEKNDVYLTECVYESGLLPNDMVIRVKGEVNKLPEHRRSLPLYCDPSEPDMIQLLKDAGLNAIPAMNEVWLGIMAVKQKKLHVDRYSVNLPKEFRSYKWKEVQGRVLDEPVKLFDHSMDGVRYDIYTHEVLRGTRTRGEVIKAKPQRRSAYV